MSTKMKERPKMKPNKVESIGDTLDETAAKLHKRIDSFLISPKHPYALTFFRSELGIRREKARHILSGYYYIVHPFSSFNTGYSIYLLILYLIAVFYVPFHASFIRRTHYTVPLIIFTILLDILTYLNIVMIFFMGYVASTGEIVLEPKRIAKRYLKTFFILDLLGSTPFIIGYKVFDYAYIRGILTIFLMTKMARLVTIIQLARHLRIVLGIEPGRLLVFVGIILVIFVINHFFVCSHLMYFRILERFKIVHPYWLDNIKFWKLPIPKQYFITCFRISKYMLAMRWSIEVESEKYMFNIFSYFVGKILMAIIFVYLLKFFLYVSSPKMHYVSKMNQLEEYMRIKQIPEKLQKNLKTFYRYKFGKVAFNETDLRRSLSNNLKRQVDKEFKMTLIKSIPLLKFLDSKTLHELHLHVTFETYTPQSIIYQFGDPAKHLYFLHSGTIAVYSFAGQELIHLTEGAHFGEIGLLSKQSARTVTVQALEFCEVFKLSRRYFVKMMKSNKIIAKVIKMIAKQRTRKFRYLKKYGSLNISPATSFNSSCAFGSSLNVEIF